jgi:hypothetical protein
VVGEPHIRFYAGAPLVSSDSGHRLGTLCVFDFRPRSFPAQQYAMLANFAEIVVREMERGMVSRGWAGWLAGCARLRTGWLLCCAHQAPWRGAHVTLRQRVVAADAPTTCIFALPSPPPHTHHPALSCRPCSGSRSR